jgi:flagellar assembly protein FliH
LIAGFEEQRSEYFANVEGEIVQLALSIAAKILHREAQVDPMLLAALVRLAVEGMREGSSVTIRVGRGRGESWKKYFAAIPSMAHVEIAEDEQLSDQDCVLETELGSANFGLDSQLKEVEQGFFDLLALRPAK